MSGRPSEPPVFADLRDGTPVRIRPLRRGDRYGIAAAVRGMSPQSRFNRFHGAISGLTGDQLAYLTQIDHDRHMAWVAETAARPSRGIGVVRIVRAGDDPHAAELALTVIDEYQRRGLGGLLLDVAERAARARGIVRLYGEILPDNRAMLALMKRRGASLSARRTGGVRAILALAAPMRVGPVGPAHETR